MSTEGLHSLDGSKVSYIVAEVKGTKAHVPVMDISSCNVRKRHDSYVKRKNMVPFISLKRPPFAAMIILPAIVKVCIRTGSMFRIAGED